MPSHSEGPGIWLSVWRCLLTHCLYERAAKVLARLRGCAGSPEPSRLAQAISTKFAWRGPYEILSVSETIKTRSRAPKPNHFLLVSKWCSHANLVRIHQLVLQTAECRQTSFSTIYTLMTILTNLMCQIWQTNHLTVTNGNYLKRRK